MITEYSHEKSDVLTLLCVTKEQDTFIGECARAHVTHTFERARSLPRLTRTPPPPPDMRFTVSGVACEKPLLFLCYEGRQRIVAAPLTFGVRGYNLVVAFSGLITYRWVRQDAVAVSKELFDIDLGEDKCLELQTHDIPECGLGTIEPGAWEILLPGLKKVEIKVFKQKQKKRLPIGEHVFTNLTASHYSFNAEPGP